MFWTIHIRYLSYVSISRNWHKTVSKLYQNGIVQNMRFSGFILFPLSFFLYSPFKQRNSNLKVLQKELKMNRMSILCFVKRDNFCFLKISDSNLLFATFSNFPCILIFEFRVLLFSKMKPRIRTAHYHILALRLLIFFRNYLLNFVYIYLIFVIPNFIFFTKHNF